MTRRSLHLTTALIALGVILPATAFAATGKKHPKPPSNCVSAQCVYHEYGSGANGSNTLDNHAASPLSAEAAARLARFGGKDRALLTYLATREGVQTLPGAHVGPVSPPGTFLAALDLGAGPIALFATLFAGAAAFGAARELRRRRAARQA